MLLYILKYFKLKSVLASTCRGKNAFFCVPSFLDLRRAVNNTYQSAKSSLLFSSPDWKSAYVTLAVQPSNARFATIPSAEVLI